MSLGVGELAGLARNQNKFVAQPTSGRANTNQLSPIIWCHGAI